MTSSEEKERDILKRTAEHFADLISVEWERQTEKLAQDVLAASKSTKVQEEALQTTIACQRAILGRDVPEIQARFKSLEVQFEQLDRLETLVSRVATDMTRLEAAVTGAEQQLQSHLLTLTDRILQPVIRKLDTGLNCPTQVAAAFDPALIFDPSEYLSSSQQPVSNDGHEVTVIHRRILYPTEQVELATDASGLLDTLDDLHIDGRSVYSPLKSLFGDTSQSNASNPTDALQAVNLDDDEVNVFN